MDIEYDGYKALAAAIVLQAFHDFRKAAKVVKSGKGDVDAAQREMKSVVDFVKSNWFNTICDIDKDCMLKRLKEVALE